MIENSKKSANHKPDSMCLKVKTMNGISYTISTHTNASVASIQGQIQQKSGVPLGSQRLLHKAVLLQPLKYLSQYGINDGDTIQLVANMLPQQISSPSISTHRQSEVMRTNALAQQNFKSKKHRYLQQRINGFTFKYQQSIQTINQNKVTIDRLLSSLNNKEKIKSKSLQPFILQNKELAIGDWADVKDVSGLWVEGQVVGKKHNYVEIHFNGYPEKYNQWIQQGSERIMPLRTQTVQSQDSPYLSPFPVNKPQIKSVKYPQTILGKMLEQLPQTFRNISYLFDELESDSYNHKYNENYNYNYNQNQNENGNYKKTLNHPQFKYSFNQEEQQLQQDIAESFKNNRSHHSPPASIHQEQYEYEDYEGEIVKLPIQKGTQIKQKQSSSIKGMIKLKNGRKQLMRSNRYIQSKSTFLGYSKTKSEHQHSFNRQQTPQKTQINQQNKNNNESEIDKKQTSVAMNLQDDRSEKQFIMITKKIQVQPQQQTQISKGQPNIGLQQVNNQFQLIITESATKHPQSQLSQQQSQTQKQQNISNKGQHDDGESSAKSFGSKRSERFLDASSMKSLNIETLHTHNENVKQQKSSHGKKNIFVFDQSEAQSVKQVQNKQNNQKGLQRSNYFYNQQGIMQQQDSQINQQANEQYFMQKKKEMIRRLRATQLAPICDRLGRMLVDLAPHLASLGYQQCSQSHSYNENLSTFTNQGSLQSKFKNYYQEKQQDNQEKSSYKSNKYWSFQIPVMLTPWQIMKLNKLLAEERGEHQ